MKYLASKKLLLLFASLMSSGETKYDYSGYQVIRIEVGDENDVSMVLSSEKDSSLCEGCTFQLWSEYHPGAKYLDLLASPSSLSLVQSWIAKIGFEWSVIIQDVATFLKENEPFPKRRRNMEEHNMDWDSYHSLDDIYGWFDYLERKFDFCQVEIIGKSFENRDMKVMKVCKGGCGNKPAMWIDSGIHPREWITLAVGTWMLNELVENNAAHPDLIGMLDWYFLPVNNPDGYYKTKQDDRLWRKSTSTYNGVACKGTDLNRNYDYLWGQETFRLDQAVTSSDSCSDQYFGPSVFSEVESSNVRDFILLHKDRIMFFQSIHSYSQLILIPGNSTHKPSAAVTVLADKGNAALRAVNGEDYTVGCIPCLLYEVTGDSLNWAYWTVGIPYAYTFELRPEANNANGHGFVLPEGQIIPTAKETWAWHEVAARQIIEEFEVGYIKVDEITASSTYLNSEAICGAQYAIDGVIRPSWWKTLHTKADTYSWVQLKLSSPRMVSAVEVFNRVDCCGDRLRMLEVRAGLESVPAGTLGDVLLRQNERVAFFPGPGENGETYKIKFLSPKLVQFITLQLTDDQYVNYLNLNELKVLGIFVKKAPCEVWENINIPGNDLNIATVNEDDRDTWQECRELCNERPECKFFEWQKRPDVSHCWIKSGISEKVPRGDHVSGTPCRAMPCCDELSVEGSYFSSGKYRKQENDYNNKAWYKHESKNWCIFHGGEDIYGGHWKVDVCGFVETEKNWSRGYGWSEIEAECPGDIGANWRYYSWSSAGSWTGPVDLSIVINCS